MQKAKETLGKHRDTLSHKPGVVSVGYGFKRRGGQLTAIPSVIVYVKKKLPVSSLTAEAVIPQSLDDTPTDVVEVKEVPALLLSGAVNWQYKRPCPGGFSIGHPLVTAGTIGLPVVMAVGSKALLTNAHIAAPYWAGVVKVGNPILQPGPADGGKSENKIAMLMRWSPINPVGQNRLDCALAIIDEDKIDWRIEGVGQVYNKFGEPQPGVKVIKSGRTTGLTRGQIAVVGAAVNVNYGSFTALFVDQLEIVSAEGKPFSKGGDSGSAILSEDGTEVLGLLFAGDESTTYANPIDLVEQFLGFSIIHKPDNIKEQLLEISGSLIRVWGYKNGNWLLYEPAIPVELNTLKLLEKGEGYWIRVNKDVTFTYHGFTYHLFKDWNLIGWMG